MSARADRGPPAVSRAEALRVWCRVAAQSFGGPAGQIAVMHRILVGERRWISETRFLHALAYCTLLPGPEAQQLATYVGWLLHGVRGGLVAGGLFVLPGFLSLLALSALYAAYGTTALVAAAFYGLKPAVLAVVVEAVLRIGRRALTGAVPLLLAAGSFLGIFAFDLPFPLIIAAGAVVGALAGRFAPGGFGAPAASPEGEEDAPLHARPRLGRTAGVLACGLAVWAVPFVVLAASLGTGHVLFREAVFFSKVAVVTFGGAYAVLSYVAQQAVATFGWLRPDEMLDGLGLAETTPGPLIQVVQFVGFLGAFRNAAPLDPWTAAVLGALVTTWVTYVPCFLWIFAGAPYVEALRQNRLLARALAGIMAVVVGVILNLSVWFALHALFTEVARRPLGPARPWWPLWSSLDPAAAAIAVLAGVAIFRLRLGVPATLGLSVILGIAVRSLPG